PDIVTTMRRDTGTTVSLCTEALLGKDDELQTPVLVSGLVLGADRGLRTPTDLHAPGSNGQGFPRGSRGQLERGAAVVVQEAVARLGRQLERVDLPQHPIPPQQRVVRWRSTPCPCRTRSEER